MEIKPAVAGDKKPIVKFCRAIYPNGDYIEDTWSSWLADGGLFTIWEDNTRIGVFNVSIRDGQGWVEGTRVHPDFRRRKAGTAVLQYAERFVRDRGGRVIRSLIENSNVASLERAQKVGWNIGDVWGWYRLTSNTMGFNRSAWRDLGKIMYVDSWRVYESDSADVLFFGGSAVVVLRARHFPHTVIATVLEAAELSELAAYLHSIDPGPRPMRGCWSPGLHVASKLDASLFADYFECIASYYLMSKSL